MAKYPVVVYGASGYTGMLTMDWLIDQNIPFTAVARDAKRVKEMMAQRVVRLESATYEIIEAEHTVKSLTKAFKGAKVVCNTVGPFVKYGLTGVEAALKAGCHHLDTTGEQAYVRAVRDQFGELYSQAGLLVSPSLAYMYSYSEIAAELALEHMQDEQTRVAAMRDRLEEGLLAHAIVVDPTVDIARRIVGPAAQAVADKDIADTLRRQCLGQRLLAELRLEARVGRGAHIEQIGDSVGV